VFTEEPLSKTEILVRFSRDISAEEVQLLSDKILSTPYKTVIIDLSEVYHINYVILGKLHMLKLDLAVRSGRLVLQGCSERLLNILKLLEVDKTVEIRISKGPESSGQAPSRSTSC
jgi:anti-anti-sigma regulatory factor